MKKINVLGISFLGYVEKVALLVLGVLSLVNILLGYPDVAVGIAIGGVLFTADFIAIKLIVKSILNKHSTLRFNIFLFVLKLILFLLLIGILLTFAKLNIYGFIIALTTVVIIIVGSGLKHGTF